MGGSAIARSDCDGCYLLRSSALRGRRRRHRAWRGDRVPQRQRGRHAGGGAVAQAGPCRRGRLQPDGRPCDRRLRGRDRDPEIRRRPERSERTVMRTHSLAWSPRPTIAHDHIAGNLERMLNNCLERYAPSLLALQRPRLELGSSHYRPQADVGVIDIGYEAGQRFVEKAYLLAEVSSEADEVVVPGTDRKWIDVKREIYRSHGHCEAVLVVAHDRMEVETNLQTGNGWY